MFQGREELKLVINFYAVKMQMVRAPLRLARFGATAAHLRSRAENWCKSVGIWNLFSL